ncbi:AraC family transcriptional regulator [Paraburkholderia strydomiana]
MGLQSTFDVKDPSIGIRLPDPQQLDGEWHMDLLSKALSDLRSDIVVTGRFTLSAPWAFVKPAVPGVPFRMCTGNPFYLVVEGMHPVFVQEGDFVLLPHGHQHTLCSSLDVPAIPLSTLLRENNVHPRVNTPLTVRVSGNGPVSDIYTSIVGFRETRRNPFLSVLPPLIHIPSGDPAVPLWLKTTLTSFIEESMSCQPGWAMAASRLADVLFVHLLRAYLTNTAARDAGWLRAMTDTHLVKAMALIHRQPSRPWTVDDLATEAGMSRSRFSARFLELVGETPIAHLTAYRMYLAAGQLMHGKARLIEVAHNVGYTSEKAFTRAFRRWAGMPPTKYGKAATDMRDLTGYPF